MPNLAILTRASAAPLLLLLLMACLPAIAFSADSEAPFMPAPPYQSEASVLLKSQGC
ncbi:MAG: hypothetical protein JWN43_2204, partial [Gammaproteobacteria bacterium]|nr:hypothetical protein [Gammaproteobacteria bacterium]